MILESIHYNIVVRKIRPHIGGQVLYQTHLRKSPERVTHNKIFHKISLYKSFVVRDSLWGFSQNCRMQNLILFFEIFWTLEIELQFNFLGISRLMQIKLDWVFQSLWQYYLWLCWLVYICLKLRLWQFQNGKMGQSSQKIDRDKAKKVKKWNFEKWQF